MQLIWGRAYSASDMKSWAVRRHYRIWSLQPKIPKGNGRGNLYFKLMTIRHRTEMGIDKLYLAVPINRRFFKALSWKCFPHLKRHYNVMGWDGSGVMSRKSRPQSGGNAFAIIRSRLVVGSACPAGFVSHNDDETRRALRPKQIFELACFVITECKVGRLAERWVRRTYNRKQFRYTYTLPKIGLVKREGRVIEDRIEIGEWLIQVQSMEPFRYISLDTSTGWRWIAEWQDLRAQLSGSQRHHVVDQSFYWARESQRHLKGENPSPTTNPMWQGPKVLRIQIWPKQTRPDRKTTKGAPRWSESQPF